MGAESVPPPPGPTRPKKPGLNRGNGYKFRFHRPTNLSNLLLPLCCRGFVSYTIRCTLLLHLFSFLSFRPTNRPTETGGARWQTTLFIGTMLDSTIFSFLYCKKNEKRYQIQIGDYLNNRDLLSKVLSYGRLPEEI